MITKKSILARYRRDFGKGVGSVLSVNGNYIEPVLRSRQAAEDAVASSWRRVGRYLRFAIQSNR